MTDVAHNEEPCFVISVVARMVEINVHTLRYYERVGLLTPSRSQGHRRLYSAREIERLRRIKTLVVDLGVNLAGVEVILRLTERMAEMEEEMERMEAEVKRLTAGQES